MAKISLSEMFSGIRGKINNTIYTTRNGQVYARIVPPYVDNPKSEDQVLARARFTNAVAGWADLTDEQKVLWVDAVTLLPSRPSIGTSDLWFPKFFNDISGFNYYVGITCLLAAVGVTARSTPPTQENIPEPNVALGITYDQPSDSFMFTGNYAMDTIVGSHYMMIRGRKRHTGALKYMAQIGGLHPEPGFVTDFATSIAPITHWRIGSGKDIEEVLLSSMDVDNYEFRSMVLNTYGQRSVETTSIFVTST